MPRWLATVQEVPGGMSPPQTLPQNAYCQVAPSCEKQADFTRRVASSAVQSCSTED